MSLFEWLLVLHVMAAFLLVASAVAGNIAVYGPPSVGRALGPLAGLLGPVGGLLTLVFGVWLVIEADGYEFTEGWIISGLILWLLAAATGGRVGALMKPGAGPSALTQARVMGALSAAAILAALVVMFFKPGV